MKSFSGFLSVLQKMGQSLMVPVSVLPAAGLIVALGRALQSAGEPTSMVHQIGQICYSGGLAVFEQLTVIFAVGVAIGFTGGAGIAGLSAVAGYFTLVNLLKVFTEIRHLELAINTGVFGGIAVGLMTAYLYNRYHKVQLPQVLGFFSGRRLIPILTVACTVLLSFVFAFGWPPIQTGINHFGQWVMDSSFAGAFYAAGKRLLIPVGLHHVFYPPFLFEFGSFTSAAGQVVHGDSARYFAGDPTAGVFMASEFPIMLFGLPAAALAMVLRAEPSRRKGIAGIMITAALTSIITGITEPIEFAFIFVAPLLYFVHVGLAFVSGFLTQLFNIHLGYTFSASIIDFVLGYFNQANSMSLWLIVGPLMAILYFTSFYTLIGVFDFKTPGRDVELGGTDAAPVTAGNLAKDVLVALGGAANIISLDACITRLRMTVNDPKRVDQSRLRGLGAAGVFHDGGQNMQVVFGTKSDRLKDEILSLMTTGTPVKPTIIVGAPLRGRVVPLSEVPDKTFAGKVLGEGVAIEPTEGVVYAPFDGSVANVFRTGHAIGLLGPSGAEVLIHVGIDTVKMGGVGFKPVVKAGDVVRKGDRLLEFDLEAIRKSAPSILTPVVVTNWESFQKFSAADRPRSVAQGDSLIELQPEGPMA